MEADMQEYVDLDGLTRRTRRLEFEDGLNDLQNALVFLLAGLMAALFMSPFGIRLYVRVLQENKELTVIGLVGLFALFVVITFGARRLIMRYRREALWKDLGQIEPLRWQVDRRISVLAVAVWLIMFIAGMFFLSRDPMDLDAGMRLVIASAGVATGLIYFMLGQALELNRYRWLGLAAGLASGLIVVAPVSAAAGWMGFSVIWALGLTISGISALRKIQSKGKQNLR
jgi:MFS family permease